MLLYLLRSCSFFCFGPIYNSFWSHNWNNDGMWRWKWHPWTANYCKFKHKLQHWRGFVQICKHNKCWWWFGFNFNDPIKSNHVKIDLNYRQCLLIRFLKVSLLNYCDDKLEYHLTNTGVSLKLFCCFYRNCNGRLCPKMCQFFSFNVPHLKRTKAVHFRILRRETEPWGNGQRKADPQSWEGGQMYE